ncbi:DUF4127 family protein [Pectinatus haikarae]|uniref:DUF4127 family protein n=1 Tax=Pectinatus haikarae TaxID=349096 RepID=UPI0018C49873|nr:DUF4127 family protein [Pectinatus haikarae]
MYKRSVFFILAAIIIAVFFQRFYLDVPVGKNITITQKYTKRVIFIPLDSRPPCAKFVIDAGRIADIEVITPPQSMMDYYTEPGNTAALRKWLAENAVSADGIIVSIDQLLYGGLLASRQSFGKEAQEGALWQMLKDIRESNPQLPIYAFNILPRITPPANIDSVQDIKNLMEYSRLTDKLSQFYDEDDLVKIEKLRGKIPEGHLAQYMDLYIRNLQLNKKLIDLAAQKVLTKVVIGQDDGEKYGIPNMERRSLQQYTATEQLDNGTVFITHGADEVGMSLLFNMAQEFNDNKYHPRIFVAYNEESSAQAILPYMAAPVEEITEEKIAMTGGRIVSTADEADFILYLHIGDDENLSARYCGAKRIKEWLKDGKKVAVVDLSRHFSADEALFPVLLANDVPVNSLLAYSGWNTVSNSVGTAVSQAALYCLSDNNKIDTDDVLRLTYNNLTVLYEHFVEDYFYLKGTIDAVNISLRKAGINNVSDLNLENNYLWANRMLAFSLQRQLDKLAYGMASRTPLTIKTSDGIKKIYLRNMKVDAFFPWPRTFEIYTDVNFTMLLGQ